MPRIPRSIIRQAAHIDRLLPPLLRACHDVDSAQNELRWLREHAQENSDAKIGWRERLALMVKQRAKGVPLQYILGTEYFGDLEILCRPGVLIPRQDTASLILYLVERLSRHAHPLHELHVLDLCTGTGCIPLLFQQEFSSRIRLQQVALRMLGVDISNKAVSLARLNQRTLARKEGATASQQRPDNATEHDSPNPSSMAHRHLSFVKGDVLDLTTSTETSFDKVLQADDLPSHWDILISNPPYISPQGLLADTARSVRNFEPRQALVPPRQSGLSDTEHGDLFYPRLLDIADRVRAKLVLFEVADMHQAIRVARCAQRHHEWEGIEIWRDELAAPDQPEVLSCSEEATLDVQSGRLTVRGQGHGRGVLCWRAEARDWLGLGSGK